MDIEELMKPYFEKQEEINKKYVVEKNALNAKLDKINLTKKDEINAYVKDALADRPNFYTGYESMVRKDLEQAYLEKEEEIKKELSNVDKYYNVDMKELIEDTIRNLTTAKEALEKELELAKLNFNIIKNKLSSFEHKYDENNRVINGNEYRDLFNESNVYIDVIYSVKDKLDKIDKYLNLMNLTQEEIINKEENVLEEEVVAQEEPTTKTEETVKEDNSVLNQEEKPVVEAEKEFFEMLNDVCSDIFKSANNIRTVKLKDGIVLTKSTGDKEDKYAGWLEEESIEEIKLPNGVYVNRKDLDDALDNYKKQAKGRTFKVNAINKSLQITSDTINKVKRSLKECSLVKLIKEKKIGKSDFIRVFGKQKSEEYSNMLELGAIDKTNVPTGDYIRLDDFKETLKNLFEEKKYSWFDKFKGKNRKEKANNNNLEQINKEKEILELAKEELSLSVEAKKSEEIQLSDSDLELFGLTDENLGEETIVKVK